MPLTTGTRLGPYEITASIGAGGMGEVYRARDTRLNRDVALKVLPDAFALDPDRLARFKREAQVLAALNHPHIAAIHGLEETDPSPGSGQVAVRALVLELVEGPTLAERLSELSSLKSQGSRNAQVSTLKSQVSGPLAAGTQGLPVDEALRIARQVADALQAAHEKGIIHRDLKPANSAFTPDGQVKVLDFGLAKALGADPRPDVSTSPTLSMAATQAGVILGTAAYMSPEQAKGREADKRSDVWAFGCVVYEMLSGRRAFEGEDISDTLAAVLRGEPEWPALPPDMPPVIRTLVQRCLDKDRRRRIADMSTALFILDEPASLAPVSPVGVQPVVAPRGRAWRRAAMLTATVIATGIVTATGVWLRLRSDPPRVTRLTIAPSSSAALSVSGFDRDLAITPDGSRVVYVGTNATQIFVRALDQLESTALAGLGTPRGLFISPDGQWIGFADGTTELKKVAVTGGPSLSVGRLDGAPRGATWGPDGTIIFATANSLSGLQRVLAAGGGEPATLTKPNREHGEADHLWPEFLPGGQAVLFTITPATGGIDNMQIAALDLRTGTQKVLVRGGSSARYLPSGHLVYGVAGTLRAVPFDLDRLETRGTPVPVLPQILTTPLGAAGFDVAGNGTLVYVLGGLAAVARTLVWVDRQGREEAIKAAPARAYAYPRLSPDGTRVALDSRDLDSDIWMWDFARETLTRFTFDTAADRFPVWTPPDGRRIVFSSNRAGPGSLFSQAADRPGVVERLTVSKADQFPTTISPDGTRVVFDDNGALDMMVITLDKERPSTPSTRSAGSGSTVSPATLGVSSVEGQALRTGTVEPSTGSGRGPAPGSGRGEPKPLVQTPFNERNGEISPDGRWLAYESNESRQFEIYVRPFPDVDSGRWQVSTGGGTRPLWARNGQELFYLSPTRALMSVRVERGSTWTAGTPMKVFEGPYYADAAVYGRTYDVSVDGRRFLMVKPVAGPDQTAASPSLIVVQNWLEELKRLVPVPR